MFSFIFHSQPPCWSSRRTRMFNNFWKSEDNSSQTATSRWDPFQSSSQVCRIVDQVIVGWYVWRLWTLSSPCHLVDSPLFWYMSYEMLTLPEQSRHAFDDGFYQNFTVIKHIIGSSGRQDAHFSPILTSRCVQNNPTMLENVFWLWDNAKWCFSTCK